MAPEEIPKLFERFHRVDEARSQEPEAAAWGFRFARVSPWLIEDDWNSVANKASVPPSNSGCRSRRRRVELHRYRKRNTLQDFRRRFLSTCFKLARVLKRGLSL